MKLTITSIVVLITLTMSGMCASVSSALPPGFLIGDNDGIHVNSDGDYFIRHDDLEPGTVITKTLTISNNENSSFSLSMTAKPLDQTGPIEILDKLNLKLTLDGKEIYNGRVYGDAGNNMIVNPLPLGQYNHGTMRKLQIELTFDKNLPKSLFKKKSIAEIRWIFYAFKVTDSTPPKTGEQVNQALYALGLLVIGFSVGLLIKHRRSRSASGTV